MKLQQKEQVLVDDVHGDDDHGDVVGDDDGEGDGDDDDEALYVHMERVT